MKAKKIPDALPHAPGKVALRRHRSKTDNPIVRAW